MPEATSEYADRLLERIDYHVSQIRPEDRLAFLQGQHHKWTANFERWMHLVDNELGTERFGNAVAFDFHATLAGISKRIAEYEPNKTKRELLLSLAVT